MDTDRYGRSVCHVYLGARHVNRELVRQLDRFLAHEERLLLACAGAPPPEAAA